MKRQARSIDSRSLSQKVRFARDFILGSLALIGFAAFFLWLLTTGNPQP